MYSNYLVYYHDYVFNISITFIVNVRDVRCDINTCVFKCNTVVVNIYQMNFMINRAGTIIFIL